MFLRALIYISTIRLVLTKWISSWQNCDGYVLDDETAVMSERGTADLLGVDHKLLNRMVLNWPPKTLKPFIDKGLSMGTHLVKVVAKNSPYNREVFL